MEMQTGPNASTLIDGWFKEGLGNDTAIITADDRRVSAAELYTEICRVASGLQSIGVGREDRVLLVLDDTPAFPASFLGAMRIGAVPVPVNFLLRAEDFGYFLDDSCAMAAVVDAPFLDAVQPQVIARPGVQLIVANGDAPRDAINLDQLKAKGAEDVKPVETRPEDMAFWLYSSGSTGPPKGVVHRHVDIGATCTAYAQPITGIRRGDVVFSSAKMFHAYGLGNNLSFPLWAGATSVYLTGKPTPDRLLERVASHRPNLLFSVPALYNAMLADPDFDGVDWSSVRLAVSAAELLPPETWRRFHERTGVEILDGIGSTEMLHIYCSNRAGACRPGTSGFAVDGYRLEIRRPDGTPCDTDEPGEMWVSGPSTLSEYWRQKERTRDRIRGEWFLTGDRYRADADGCMTYEGRVDDMMKIGGLWVSPIEIENRLMEHEAVSEAAVVQVEIDHCSRIGAWVILNKGNEGGDGLAEELRKWCKSKLQRYQFPHVVNYVKDFPRTVTGKIQRFKLRKIRIK